MKRRSSQQDYGPSGERDSERTTVRDVLRIAAPRIAAPRVFQCIKCFSALGDSFRMLSSNEETNTITLSGELNYRSRTSSEARH